MPIASLKLRDLDDVELLTDVERAFDVNVSDDEAAQLFTMGDVFDLVARKFALSGGAKCASALSFYQLREALLPWPGLRARPSMRLKQLPPRAQVAFMRAVRAQNGTLARVLSPYSVGAICCGLLSLLALPSAALSLLLLAATCLFSLLAFLRWPFSHRERSLGSLAESCVILNYAKLVSRGARHSEALLWSSVCELAATRVDVAAAEITRDTRLV